MSFYTAINCMDGRAQIPVIRYLRERFGIDHVDMITEPGPNGILAAGENRPVIESIMQRVELSLRCHGSVGIAVIGHHDCAGNPAPAAQQEQDTVAALFRLRSVFPDIPVIGLWVDENWEVEEIGSHSTAITSTQISD